MSDKPSYLGLLNAIALAEANACEYLTAWIEVTPSAEVCAVLRKVAAREGEHGMAFAKRIDELGYQVRPKEDPGHAKRLKIARSNKSDLEKMEALGLHKIDTGDQPDIFDKFFSDHSIDIQTGELLGRYIAEERDTGRRLRSCYQQLKAAANGDSAAGGDDRLDVLEDKIDSVCRAVEDLRQIVCAQTMPAATS
jgi:Mn-containing catalase